MIRHPKRFLAATLLACAPALPASAALRVYSPYVEEGEAEIETQFDATADHRPTKTGAYTANISVGYGVTSFWKAEVEGQWKRDPQGGMTFDSTSFENVFQVTEQGKYDVDVGFFAEIETVRKRGDHNSITLGPIFRKEFGSNVTTVNFLFTHELGNRSAAGATFETRVQSLWPITDALQGGIEAYWQPGRLGAFPGVNTQGLRSGPALAGDWRVPGLGKLKYELGYLVGITANAPQGTLRGVLEYEFRF